MQYLRQITFTLTEHLLERLEAAAEEVLDDTPSSHINVILRIALREYLERLDTEGTSG